MTTVGCERVDKLLAPGAAAESEGLATSDVAEEVEGAASSVESRAKRVEEDSATELSVVVEDEVSEAEETEGTSIDDEAELDGAGAGATTVLDDDVIKLASVLDEAVGVIILDRYDLKVNPVKGMPLGDSVDLELSTLGADWTEVELDNGMDESAVVALTALKDGREDAELGKSRVNCLL
jgi:hypothetical protein